MTPSFFHDELRDDRQQALARLAELASTPGSEAAVDAYSGERVELLERLLGVDVCRRLGIYRLPDDFLLSVVVPVYNEAGTVERVIERIRGCGLPLEIILVDDGSSDGTRELLRDVERQRDLKVLLHQSNQGKGAAVRTGLAHAAGDVVVIQDADMEYDPRDFRRLLQPIVEGEADVVYGSRYSGSDRAVAPLWHRSANRLITALSNLATGLQLTDVETCYKMFRREVILPIVPQLVERGFGIELEITARLARTKRCRFYERPISYARRSYAEGKKIGWRDGLWALWCIVRY